MTMGVDALHETVSHFQTQSQHIFGAEAFTLVCGFFCVRLKDFVFSPTHFSCTQFSVAHDYLCIEKNDRHFPRYIIKRLRKLNGEENCIILEPSGKKQSNCAYGRRNVSSSFFFFFNGTVQLYMRAVVKPFR